MASLSAHLRQTEGHGRLAFHPDCPICGAERLSGTLLNERLVARRAQAAVVAGVLAMATPAVALAQEPDQFTEGTIAPTQAGQDPALDPDFDPGGESDNLPFDEPDDPEVVEHEPPTDLEGPIADAGDESVEAETVTPSPVATVTPAPSPAPEPAAATDPVGQVAAPPANPRSDGTSDRRPAARHRDQEPAPVAPAESIAPTATSAPVAVATRGSAKPGDRHYVVRPGESLWSIAREIVGDDASAARIAREVNLLWELNNRRIATGDPDLLRVGTKLTLR